MLLFLSLLLGMFYYSLVQVNIGKLKPDSHGFSHFSFHIDSKIDQETKLHLAAGSFKLRSVECNGKTVRLQPQKMRWFEKPSEEVSVLLQRGDNACRVSCFHAYGRCLPVVKQKITYVDYGILFLLLGLPLYHMLFSAFIRVLDRFRNRRLRSRRAEAKPSVPPKVSGTVKTMGHSTLLYGILALGILVRILYFHRFGIMNFQHDWQGHIAFIKYIAEHWTLPLPSKGLEFPQQPLYYWITGGLYALFTHLGLNDHDALYGLGFFSLLCSFLFLYYGYRFMMLVTQSEWVRAVAMLFLSLTPSLVYMSARINNDVLVMALSAFSLYAMVKSYQSGFQKGFYAALLGVSLLFLTKISAAPLEVLLFALLIAAYLKEEDISAVRRNLYGFGALGLFLLGFTLLRVYLPVEETFHLVNSSGHFPGQSIKALDLNYFGTFHIGTLIQTGSSHVFGKDAIRFSFPTYQYGTMFFGEFDYTWFLNQSPWLHDVMQAVLALGLVYLLGIAAFILFLYRASLLEKLLFATFLLNLLLILKFMFDYPSVCNTDFRYFVGSFVLLAFFFAKGLASMYRVKFIGYLLNVWLALLAFSELLFFILLIGI